MRKDSLMKKLLASILALSLAAFPTDYVQAAPEEAKELSVEKMEGEIIVVYDDAGVSDRKSATIQKEAEQSLADKDIMVTNEISESDEEQGTVVTAEIPEDMDVDEAVEMAMEDEKVVYAQPNFIYEAIGNVETEKTVNDTYVIDESAYYLTNAHVKDAWDIQTTDKEVTVAVLDTGCRMDHEDLQGNIISELAYDVLKDEILTADSTSYGGDAAGGNLGHGTHVCGLVAAQADNGVGMAGTSYNANIIPVKIFDDAGGNATTATVLEGLEYCQSLIDQKKVDNFHVINLSVGVYSSGTGQEDVLIEDQIIKLANDYNVLCVCAGGNGDESKNPITTPMYPSDFDACLSVTALDKDGNNCTWSDYNMYKDISAPGLSIVSTMCDSDKSYINMSGTSMATPIVSGICALLWAKDPDLTVEEVKTAIKSTADPVTSNATDGREGNTGSAGAINAKAALEYVQKLNGSSELKVLTDENVKMPDEKYIYSKERIKPEPEVSYNGIILEKDKDYTVSYENNINPGTARLIVQGIKEYSGTVEKEFVIDKASIASCTYSLSAKNIPYTGKEITPFVTLYFKGKPITQGEDYTVRYSNNINAGRATVVVSGCGQFFEGSGKFYFTITEVGIESLSLSMPNTIYTYDGYAKYPSVSISSAGVLLTNGIDYTISYSNNVKVGTARAVITATGQNYTGSVTRTFEILPKGTKISKLSKGSKSFKVTWKKQKTQTTGYQIQYATNKQFSKAKTKTIKKNKTTSVKISKLKKKRTYYVRIRTYKTVDGRKYYSSWSGVKKVKTK